MKLILCCIGAGIFLGFLASLSYSFPEEALSYAGFFGIMGGLAGISIKLVACSVHASNVLAIIGLGSGIGFLLGFLAGLPSASSIQLGIAYALFCAVIAVGIHLMSHARRREWRQR